MTDSVLGMASRERLEMVMAYLTIMTACKDGNHGECPGTEHVPVDPDIVGGGICVCECHERVAQKLTDQVRENGEPGKPKRCPKCQRDGDYQNMITGELCDDEWHQRQGM